MAQNVFDATLDVNNNIKQNVFDWTHNNNLTTQLGRITPIFCDLLPAKSSFRVDPNFGMQFMPMVFPIQTSMRARIAFFRYPLRALWEDYTDFVGNFREGLEEPYVDINTQDKLKKMASTCSLGDYLGLPTTSVGNFGTTVSLPAIYASSADVPFGVVDRLSYNISSVSDVNAALSGSFIGDILYTLNAGVVSDYVAVRYDDLFDLLKSDATSSYTFRIPLTAELVDLDSSSLFLSFWRGDSFVKAYSVSYTDGDLVVSVPSTDTDWSEISSAVLFVRAVSDYPSGSADYTNLVNSPVGLESVTLTFDPDSLLVPKFERSVVDLDLTSSPWYNSNSVYKNKQIKLSAYSFRAYEGIYNAYFRDNRNNPYYIDGKVQYNKWIPTLAGGKDDNIYELRYANWERDFLTTAVQSPQQGTAPLVGITTYTQTVSNEDGTTTELVKTALVDEDGKKFGLSYKTSDDGLEGVEYTELSDGTQVRQARNLYDLATSGISIADLRAVNAYQKFLELNMRKGYSYRDIMQGRFDVKVRYDALLMPEFFGGCTRDVETHSVTQTVDQAQGINPTYAEALGSQAGLSGVRGSANANIECFCDEESIIIGVMIISPSAVYTQLLPKHFTYRGLMDHFQPEFNNIGFQPILYKEVCPIQAYNASPDSLTDTFGYNRPWYEYVQKYDQAHGLFRTNLSNFLMHRVFDQKPELAQSFLIIDPEQVTDVFAVTETTDKIYGQIRMNCTVKLPVSRVAIPRLD